MKQNPTCWVVIFNFSESTHWHECYEIEALILWDFCLRCPINTRWLLLQLRVCWNYFKCHTLRQAKTGWMFPTFLLTTILRIYMGHGVINTSKLKSLSKISRRILEMEAWTYYVFKKEFFRLNKSSHQLFFKTCTVDTNKTQ